MNVKRMCRIAMMTALLCVISPLSLPIGAIPISLATLGVYFTGICLGSLDGLFAVGLYLLLGIVGVPVFSGYTAGLAHIAGATGGYLVGYLPMAVLSGLARGRSLAVRILFLILATAACYALGTIWFVLLTQSAFAAAMAACVLPFLPGDCLKILAVALPAKRLEKIASNRKTDV